MLNPSQYPPVERAILVRSLGVRQTGNVSLASDESGSTPRESGLQLSYTSDPLCGPFGLCVPNVLPWVRGRG